MVKMPSNNSCARSSAGVQLGHTYPAALCVPAHGRAVPASNMQQLLPGFVHSSSHFFSRFSQVTSLSLSISLSRTITPFLLRVQ